MWSQLVMCIKQTCPQSQFLPFQPLCQHGPDQRSVKGHQGHDSSPAHGWNGPEDHQQEALWEGKSCWCDFSEMEEI